MKRLKFLLMFLLITAFFAGCEQNDFSSGNDPESLLKAGSNVHAVYTLSNSPSGNEVLMFKRSANGTLSHAGSFPTGGLGTGSGLGSQGAIILYNGFIFAVNAGSNEVTVLKAGADGLTLVDKKPSGGTMPVSVTAHDNLLYILNAGGTGNIFGFRIGKDGMITPIAGSERPLSSASSAPAQIEFSPDGSILVVTEKAANIIDTYSVGSNGLASGPNSQPSAGQTPFGFAFDKRGHIIVSEAFGGAATAGAMSSYNVNPGGINLITGPVYNFQAAPCWVVVTNNGKYAYVTNTASGNISGYHVDADGSITLFNDGGNTASTGAGSAPIDMALSNNSRYLYALSGGTNTISAFVINNGTGRLTSLQIVGGLPPAAAGLAGN